MAWEIPFEALGWATETTRGTKITNPTHYLAIQGMITPRQPRARPTESRGTLARHHRSEAMQRFSEWSGEGPLDNYILPVLLKTMIKGGSFTPTTPVGGTNARLWTRTPSMTSDDLNSGTIFWGDPNVQAFSAGFAMIDEFTIEDDASGTDEVRMSLSGRAHFPDDIADPTMPAQLTSPLFVPSSQQLWIDTGGDAIGTTEVTGRVLGGSVTLNTGITYKWVAQGPDNDLNYALIGRDYRALEMNLRFEVPDLTEYNRFIDGDVLKIRRRWNGPLIEGSLYHYVQLDCYAPVDALDWGDNQGSNRVAELSFISEYDTTAGYDFAFAVQNDRNTL